MSMYSRNDPKTGTEKTGDKGVGSVKSDLGSLESDWAKVAESQDGSTS
jgi:hypothetical protein